MQWVHGHSHNCAAHAGKLRVLWPRSRRGVIIPVAASGFMTSPHAQLWLSCLVVYALQLSAALFQHKPHAGRLPDVLSTSVCAKTARSLDSGLHKAQLIQRAP